MEKNYEQKKSDVYQQNRIRTGNIELLKDKVFKGREKCLISSYSFYLDSVVLNLHNFYSALESIFVMIAKTLDGGIPLNTLELSL